MAFVPSNDLEHSLVKASTDAAHRPQFYRDFIKADLFVVQDEPLHSGAEQGILRKGEKLHLRTFERAGHTVIPIFSSLPRLQTFIKEEVSYLAMKAPDFLKMTRGASLILNPGPDFGKEFTSEEIGSILDGSLWKPSERYVAQKDTKVLIGQPANYPAELASALSRYFQATRQVKRAYLAHFFNPERDAKPHTLIAIEVTGDWDLVASGAGLIAQGVSVPDPPVDFMQITGKGGIEQHVQKSVKPFYEKKKFLGIF